MGFKRLILNIMLKISRSKLKRSLSIYGLRTDYKLFSKVMYLLNKREKDVEVDFPTINGIYGLRARPPHKNNRIILYFHGGAFIIGLKELKNAYIPFATRLAKECQSEVWIPDYSNAPEHPYPEAHEDCLASYLNLIERGIDPKDITVMGDSCGAALALGLVLTLRDRGLPLPGSVATISAWTDLSLTAESIKTRASRDPMFEGAIKGFAEHYLQGVSPYDPKASPFYNDFTGFPPLYMVVGGCEILYDDTTRVVEKAKQAGVDVTLDANEDMIHIYPIFFDIIDEGKAAIKRIANFVNEKSNEMPAETKTLWKA